MANHVMFVSPFLSFKQITYDASMTQAIGRAWRFGQTKDVKVYHFLALNTIEVNIIQKRTGKVLVREDEDGEFSLVVVDDVDDLAPWYLAGWAGDPYESKAMELGSMMED